MHKVSDQTPVFFREHFCSVIIRNAVAVEPVRVFQRLRRQFFCLYAEHQLRTGKDSILFGDDIEHIKSDRNRVISGRKILRNIHCHPDTPPLIDHGGKGIIFKIAQQIRIKSRFVIYTVGIVLRRQIIDRHQFRTAQTNLIHKRGVDFNFDFAPAEIGAEHCLKMDSFPAPCRNFTQTGFIRGTIRKNFCK